MGGAIDILNGRDGLGCRTTFTNLYARNFPKAVIQKRYLLL